MDTVILHSFAPPSPKAYSSCLHQHISKAALNFAMPIRGCKMPNANEAMATKPRPTSSVFWGRSCQIALCFSTVVSAAPLHNKLLPPKGLKEYIQCRRYCLKYLYLSTRSTIPLIPITSAQYRALRYLLPQSICSLHVGAAPSLLQGTELPLIS